MTDTPIESILEVGKLYTTTTGCTVKIARVEKAPTLDWLQGKPAIGYFALPEDPLAEYGIYYHPDGTQIGPYPANAHWGNIAYEKIVIPGPINDTLEVGKHYITSTKCIIKVKLSMKIPGGTAYQVEGVMPHSNIMIYYEQDGTLSHPHPITNEWGEVDFKKTATIPDMELYLHQHAVRLKNITSAKAAFEHLRLWGEATFGPVDPKRIVERAKEEFINELVPAVEEGWTDKALEEAADVIVILTRAPGLWEAIEKKMAINYERDWNVKGDGTGYHIPKVDETGTE